MGLLKKKNNELQASAAISDDCLIVSLPQAIEPSVWRLELEKAKNAAFEIQKDDDDIFSLVIKKSARSKPDIIGNFENKDDAMSALLIVSEALKTGKTKTATTKTTPKKSEASPAATNNNDKNSNAGVIALIATLVVIALFYYNWFEVMPSVNQIETREITSSATTSPQNQTGVPVSADDFLQGF